MALGGSQGPGWACAWCLQQWWGNIMFSDLPPGCDNLPTSELLFSAFCVLCSLLPRSQGGRALQMCSWYLLLHCCRSCSVFIPPLWLLDGREKRSVNLSYPSTFFIVIVASLPDVWSDYPMALMIERQDWGLRVINDFESCHHLPNLCRVTWPRSTSTASTVTRRMSCVGLILTATDLSKIFLRWELGIPSLSKQCFSTLGSFQTRSKSNQSQASIQSNIKYETWTCLHSNLHRGPLF